MYELNVINNYIYIYIYIYIFFQHTYNNCYKLRNHNDIYTPPIHIQ